MADMITEPEELAAIVADDAFLDILGGADADTLDMLGEFGGPLAELLVAMVRSGLES